MRINTNTWNRVRYTAFAPLYDRLARFGPQRKRSIELLALQPGERVLIVGAGTGADLPFIPAGVEVVAGDITPAMVERVRARARKLGRPAVAEVMDGQELPLPDGTFDAVILHLIIAVIPDPAACLRETARVLKSNGRAVVFDKFVPDARGPSLLRRVVNLATNALFSDITRRLGPLVHGSGLRIVHREPAALGGAFEIAALVKNPSAPGSQFRATEPAGRGVIAGKPPPQRSHSASGGDASTSRSGSGSIRSSRK
jgi:phosphatidylethanolamine/phosphatidyl-N-methylethanolamine N-methyltransferase